MSSAYYLRSMETTTKSGHNLQAGTKSWTVTTLGKKFLMSLTGLIAVLFLIAHLASNLLVFVGQESLNSYAAGLREFGPGLWVARLILIIAAITHIWLGLKLKAENNASRPISYSKKQYTKATPASRMMWLTGLVILAFLAYHLAHFTFLLTNPEFQQLVDSKGRLDVYSMVIIGFSNVWVSIFYVIALALTSHHLSHGIQSMFQSVGVNNARYQRRLKTIAIVVSTLLFIGFSSIPLAILLDLIPNPVLGP